MSRYIDADSLYEKLEKQCYEITKYCGGPEVKQYRMGFQEAIDTLKNEPAVEVKEVKHGHWVEMVRIRKGRSVRLVHWQCSLCGCFLGTNTANYCPNCGAKMESVEGLEED